MFLPMIGVAQDSVDVKFVSQYSKIFNLSDKPSGEGWELLAKEFSQSQFVLLGEYHGDARIAEFTESIIPILAKEDFKYFALETGPYSTEVLNSMCEGKAETEAVLSELYSEYYKESLDIPIPFLEGKEDVAFLNAAYQNGFEVFGIDQEYYASTLLLFERLLALDQNDKSGAAYQKAKQFVIAEHKIDMESDDYELHKSLLESEQVNAFFETLDSESNEIQSIIRSLKTSWTIYMLYDNDRMANLQMRADFMKETFSSKYKEFEQSDSLPKILIKMGGSHTQRGLTSNKVYDIGNLISELADFNGANDLNIAFMFRYYEDEEEPNGYFDNAEGNSKWLNARKPLMLQGKVNEWTVIDLRSLKRAVINNRMKCSSAIYDLLFDVDLIIIPPKSKDIELHYSTGE